MMQFSMLSAACWLIQTPTYTGSHAAPLVRAPVKIANRLDPFLLFSHKGDLPLASLLQDGRLSSPSEALMHPTLAWARPLNTLLSIYRLLDRLIDRS